MKKKCTKCKLEKDVSEFYGRRNSEDKLMTKCKYCTNEKRRETYLKKKKGYLPKYTQIHITISDELTGKHRVAAYNKEYRKLYQTEISLKKKLEKDKAQIEGIKHYGSKCSCCGETEPKFLTIEHTKGRDKTKKRRTGKENWLQLKWAKWPEDITLLCFNCNCAKGAFGKCPHQI